MDLHQLRCLCAIVDQGSFAAASESLGLTQPALSMQVARLEDELGVTLLVKTGRRKVLGPEGEVVLARARRILSEARGLLEDCEALQGLEKGSLAVAASDTVVRHLLTEPLAAFVSRWPGVHLHVWNRTSAETLDLVSDGRADLGVLTLPVVAPGLDVRPWRRFSWVAVAPASLGTTETPATIEELAASTLVLLEPGTRLHALWHQACVEHGVGLGRYRETGSTDTQLDFARRGLGIALVPDYAVTERHGLVVRSVPALGEGRLALVLRTGRQSRACEAFLESFPQPGAPG